MKVLVFTLCLLVLSPAAARAPAVGIARVGESVFAWGDGGLSVIRGGKTTRVKTRLPGIHRVVPQGERAAYVMEVQTLRTSGGWVSHGMVELLDARGAALGAWDLETRNLAVAGGAAYALATQKVIRLDAKGRMTAIDKADPREQQLLVSHSGQLVICRARSARREDPLDEAGCRALGAWSFTGRWHTVAPLLCGEWLIEAEQREHDKHASKLRVRTMATGAVVSERELSTASLTCDGLLGVVDLSNQQWLSLPKLEAKKVSCGGNEVRAVSEGACLDDRGNVSAL